MIISIRAKLLIVFLIFSMVSIGILGLSLYYSNQKQNVLDINNSINRLQNTTLQDFNTINDFFNYESKNAHFFQTGESFLLDTHDSLFNNAMQQIKSVSDLKYFQKFKIDSTFIQVQTKIEDHASTFNTICAKLKIRGFKDEGLIGELRLLAHALEKNKNIRPEKLLSIRRHEKDYMLRYENIYVGKLQKEANELISEIKKKVGLSDKEKTQITNTLLAYITQFEHIVNLDNETGFHNKEGLQKKLNQLQTETGITFQHLNDNINQQTLKLINQQQDYYLSLTLLLLVAGVIIAIILSNQISRPISKLAKRIAMFVDSGFAPMPNLKFETNVREIRKLIKNYLILKHEITTLVKDFEDKVEERTQEIEQQKQEIESQNEFINKQNEELLKKNTLIENQRIFAESKNKSLTDSINYARQIQRALMPDKTYFESIFPESFIFYQPKDIVSGDFYWIKEIKNDKFDLTLVAVVDCTGHGVPGALMSVLGIAYLNEIVVRKNVTKPSHMLDALMKNLTNSLQSEKNTAKSKDGMEIALCVFDNQTGNLQFAGANRPLFIIRNNDFIEIKGDKIALFSDEKYVFSNVEIELQSGDNIYLFTDGYYDQDGGNHNRRFMRKQFKNLLKEVSLLPMKLQCDILQKTFNEWKNGNPQIDDVCVIGIRTGNHLMKITELKQRDYKLN